MLCKPFSIEPHWGKMWWSSLRFGQQRIELGNVNTSWYPLPPFVNPLTATLHPPPFWPHTHTPFECCVCDLFAEWHTNSFRRQTPRLWLAPKLLGLWVVGCAGRFSGFPRMFELLSCFGTHSSPFTHTTISHLPPPTSHVLESGQERCPFSVHFVVLVLSAPFAVPSCSSCHVFRVYFSAIFMRY